MKSVLRWSLAACLLMLPALASAAYSCTIFSSGFAAAYSPSAATTNITATYFTITCTRALSDSATMSYSVTNDNGVNSNGIHNRAAFGGSYISYDLYQNSTCSTAWRNTKSTALSGSLNFSGSTSATATVPYYGCVGTAQSVPAGTYTDTVTMTLGYGANSTATGTFGVSIATPATCNITTAPTDIVFSYASLGPTVNANTSYGVTCTNALPYTMALDATTGTVIGITYTLALSATSATGSGVQQLYTINGSIPAGQSGTCGTGSCTASQGRTLTITY